MNRDTLQEALNEISDAHIAETAQSKVRKRPHWIGPVAAVLAAAILVSALFAPRTTQAQGLVAAPEYPEMAAYPQSVNDNAGFTAWRESRREQYDQPLGYAYGMNPYFAKIIPALLAGTGDENAACSPLNTYMALAMLAEITSGSSQSQILELMGPDNLDDLRTQAGHIWNAHYCADNATACLLANSLWLDSQYTYNATVVNDLAKLYYASVYQGDLGSREMNSALQAWLNEQTGGLLKEQAESLGMDGDTALALATTVYYRAKWSSENAFLTENSTQGVFHGPSGDMTCTFMNSQLYQNPYFQGADFSATYLELDDGSRMWLILPNEGQTPQSVLESGAAVSLVLGSEEYLPTQVKIDLCLPKFDIAAESDIVDSLKNIGVTEVFDPNSADFSAILPDQDAFLSEADHAVRVAIDEEGVTAAAYTVLQVDSNGLPPETTMEFTLDRPFLFVITSRDDLPLFAGVVNQP